MGAHPYADLFPLLEGAALESLASDIREHGQRENIIVFGGLILDGRNRWRACEIAGVRPETTTFHGSEAEALALVLSLNLHRRHLSESQRAMVAARLATMKQGERTDLPSIEGRSPVVSQKDAADLCNVGLTSVQRARSVMSRGDAALVAAVDGGLVPVSLAVGIAKKSVDLQHRVIEKIKHGTEARMACLEVSREEACRALESIEATTAKALTGVYDVIVLDPPWPMEMIERDVRPNQVKFVYPTMTEEELRGLDVPCAADAHVWVWTTHKFLPMALRLLDAWGLKYGWTSTWHKPGGFQACGGPQYNSEFAIYARRGAPRFIDTKAFNTCFQAPRGKHSEKPEEFYEVLRRVTAGRRLDMFNRRAIEGFDGWGNQAHEAAE
jgi:N6-adenosine-specific RNA methylase IME4